MDLLEQVPMEVGEVHPPFLGNRIDSIIWVLFLSAFGLALAALGQACSPNSAVTTDFSSASAGFDSADGKNSGLQLITRRHLSNFKLCAQRSLAAGDVALKGHEMIVAFSVARDGQARYVTVLSQEFQGSAYAQCVQRILRWVKFPNPPGDGQTLELVLVLDEEQPLVGQILAER